MLGDKATNKRPREAGNQAYSIRRAGASNFNSAKLVFLSRGDPALTSSCPIPASFVHIHVDAYIFTLIETLANYPPPLPRIELTDQYNYPAP